MVFRLARKHLSELFLFREGNVTAAVQRIAGYRHFRPILLAAVQLLDRCQQFNACPDRNSDKTCQSRARTEVFSGLK